MYFNNTSILLAIVFMIIFIISLIDDKKKKRISAKKWIIGTLLGIVSIMLGILPII